MSHSLNQIFRNYIDKFDELFSIFQIMGPNTTWISKSKVDIFYLSLFNN